MSKNKLLIYLLSTTLIMPTFTTQTAIAKDDSDATRSKSNVTQHHTQSNEDKTTDTTKNQQDDKRDTTSSKKQDKKDNSKNDKSSTSSQSHQTTTAVTDKNKRDHTNLVDSFYNNISQSQSKMSNLLKSDKYDQSFSLTTLIQNLFNFDSDISNYEQPDTQSNHSTTTSQNDSNSNASSTSNDTSALKQNTTSNGKTEDKPSSQSKTQTQQNSNSASNVESDDSKVSDALSQWEKEDSKKDTSSQQRHSNKDTSQQSPTQSQHQNSKQTQPSQSEGQNKGSSMSDSALDAILDEYSEDAKKTQSNYKQNKDASHKASTNSKSSHNENPQLPTNDELKHKSKPVQSFEDNVKQNNTRSTSLFQQIPQLEDGQVEEDNFNVVDSQDTRQFIKSIAKHAHKIGQKENIYASVMMAQAILESDSGKSTLAQSPNFNLFGVKGNYNGQSVNFNTLEAGTDNQMFNINAGFRKYPNLKSSLQDYADLIKHGIDGNPDIYKPTWKDEALTYKDATSHLSHSYATDPDYAKKLNSIIKHYNLTEFDKKRMPNLKKYTKSIGTDTSGSDFKPFVESSKASPYPQGQCTWYVYNRMQQYDASLDGNLGDAHNWNNRAESEGYSVTHSPKNHTAVVFEPGQLGADTQYGHVAFVEKVNDDGSIVISESNVKGLGVISYRTIDAADAADLDYIQGK
ncbi:amidase domain-containing protein [Staphylococcus caprae]|uniref:amidase domain-containing protein n=1 Tax=Staphylococcus caprae TaxID=29380 RepID=UPI001C122680|nr:amidase domain-containing protein [Staphylococcus caprae]MBU5272424.1 amidase domain-containing protein [Staphylococcus caprae]